MNRFCILLVLVLLCSCTGGVTYPVTFSGSLSIQVKDGTTLPTYVVTGNTETVYFTVTNVFDVPLEGVYINTLPTNVTQVTSGGTYSDTCSSLTALAVSGSCTLQLTISGAVDSSQSIQVCSGVVEGCVSSSTISVSEISSFSISPTSSYVNIGETQQFTATATFIDSTTQDLSSTVTWNSSDAAVASVSTSGLATALTLGTSEISVTLGDYTSSAITLEVNPVFAYIASLSLNTVTLCTIDSDTNQLKDCDDSGAGAIFSTPVGLTLSADKNFLYIANDADDSIAVCAVDPSEGTLSDCSTTGSELDQPVAIDFNAGGTVAYIANEATSKATVCDVSTSDGTLSNCTQSGSGLLTVNDIAVNTSDTRAYLADLNSNAVFQCELNQATGLFDSCADSGGGTFSNPTSLKLNAASSLAFVDDGGITVCDVSSSTGAFSNCVDSGLSGIVGMQDYVFHEDETLIYITSSFFFTHKVTLCDLDPATGAISNCATAAGDDSASFTQPTGIALK